MSARIEDVAAAVGVSAMTVSRALRGVEGVSERKRSEILRVARRLGYVPNKSARSLAVAHSNLIGLSFPHFFDDVFPDILDGMRATFDKAGYETVVDISGYSKEREEGWVDRMLAWHPAGVVLSGVHHAASVRRRLREARIPTLEVWDYSVDPIDICVGIDHAAVGTLAARHLMACGYRQPALVGIAAGLDARAEARFAGFRAMWEELGLGTVGEARTERTPSFEGGMDAIKALFGGERPAADSLFFLNDHMAFGGLCACEALGLNVPADIGIIGFNGLGINTVLAKPMTTIVTPRRLMGSTGARNLLARICGARIEPQVALPVTLEVGKTTRMTA